MILIHNHPGGTTKASTADKDFTDRMLKAGNMLNIQVIDHLVITEDAYLSFADEGIMDELKHSGMYELVERDKVALNEMRVKAERDIEIAIKLKKAGVDVDTIKEATGLKKGVINKLK